MNVWQKAVSQFEVGTTLKMYVVKGDFKSPQIQHDCGSLVVDGQAVMEKEEISQGFRNCTSAMTEEPAFMQTPRAGLSRPTSASHYTLSVAATDNRARLSYRRRTP